MKKVLLLLLTIFLFNNSQAQDTIIKRSGDTIIAKVSEITPNEVKYKRFDFQDGPNYIESKSNIQMIKFSNGIKEVFNQEPAKVVTNTKSNDYYTPEPVKPNNKIDTWGIRYRYQGHTISEREMQEVLLKSKNKQVIGLVGQAKDAKKMQYIGFAGIPLGVTSVIFLWKSTGIFSNSYNYTNGKLFNSSDLAISAVCAAAAITCPIVSGISKGNRNKYNRQAIKIYNEKF
ncbi:MAG: hypothetical protein JNL24_06455 [Bacteroidia bacterium]|nr:hypothetical protein [Bacteroidia bacterium]